MATLPFLCASLPLTADDVRSTMDALGADAAAVWSILQVESGKAGFLPDRRPQILFERAIFHRQSKGAYDGSHPGVSQPSWGGYVGGEAEYARLGEAFALDADAALQSASWGIGQIMGFNYQVAGYGGVREFVQDMCASEGAQLRAFERFLLHNGIASSLAAHKWDEVARKYNGPAQVDAYALKLKTSYTRLLDGKLLPDLSVREVQLTLGYLAHQTGNRAFSPGSVDGTPGARTLAAANAFLVSENKPLAAHIDADLAATLREFLAEGTDLRLG